MKEAAKFSFYVGLDDLYYAFRFERSFISVNRLRTRKSPFKVNKWIMDSGAFTEVTTHGGYRTENISGFRLKFSPPHDICSEHMTTIEQKTKPKATVTSHFDGDTMTYDLLIDGVHVVTCWSTNDAIERAEKEWAEFDVVPALSHIPRR